MKNIYALVIMMCCIAFTTFGQVGINTDNSAPDPSAMLDVKSPAKGLLPPRVALTATNVAGPVSSPAIGLQVYNTATAGTSPYNVRPGIYCWDGTQWIPVIAPKGANIGDMQYWNGTQWITVPVGSPGQFLQLSSSNIPMWAGGTFATIITTPATSITASAATSGGTISSDGGSAITFRGICYNTAPNPTTANYKITSGSGTGTYSITITGLTANTVWYARAYAINGAGTVYGNEITFTTLSDAVVPSLVTTAIGNINSTTAASGGYINNSGGATVTSRGVCWNTSPNPTIANSKTTNGTGTGGFISSLTGLLPNTLYYVRAYATNSAGTGYGNELSFTTLCASPVAVSVSITTSANPVCAGSSVTFTANPTNGGSSPVYQWKVNGAIVGSNSPTYSFTPLNNDVVSCILTSNLACVTGNPVTSNAITMTVNPSSSVGVTIAASANPVCAGITVTYTATPVNGGTAPTYIWKVNGNTVSGATTSTYSYVPVHNDAVVCQMTSNAPCVVGNPAMSNIINMVVNPIPTVSVSIEASTNPVCDGSIVSLQATPTNGGINPTYQWKVNGINVGTNNSVLMYTPANNDSVRCIMTSSLPCASNTVSSNTIFITVNPMQSVGVTIAASANNVCSGTTVTFTATVTNAGTISNYQWKKGGVVISGATTMTYSYVPVNNDVITCVFTSNPPCTFSNTATSNAITMTVTPVLPISVTISASDNPFISGSTVTFIATPINGGTVPTYQWKVNGISVGTNNNTYSYIPVNNDSVFCVLTSNDQCVTGNPATSNKIVMTVAPGIPCPGVPTVTYGGKTYNTVQIGNQCWFKENLNIGTKINGTQAQMNNGVIEKYCCDNLETNCDVYGGLYQWNEMMNYTSSSGTNPSGIEGICPSGWHLPSDAEWCQLEMFLDASVTCSVQGWRGTDAGGKMKEQGYNHWATPNVGATNISGFSALPGANVGTPNVFADLYNGAWFWSTTESTSPYAYYRALYKTTPQIARYDAGKTNGHSARCIKGCTTAPSPSYGIHAPSQTQIIWNWNTVTGATGYKWSTTNDYSNATDMGTATTKTETGLTCNTPYTRYVWAYNSCGNSTPVTLNATTSACPFTCGQTITKNHVAGSVAPVNKTTTYGTVTGIPGEAAKCWITKNLGATQQATAVNDATEASAGWYWQFNRKQGFKNDGSTTPAWTITSIYENSDWLTANDPCNLELGTQWRIPTYTEWSNVDNTGGWTDWNGPWGSGLKLHAAGYLGFSNGSLGSRGSYGYYWSSTQTVATNGWYLGFNSGGGGMGNYPTKASGFSVRCVRDY